MAAESMESTGKEDDQVLRRKTLFVRNLPFTATDKQLEDAFSDYGPIKRSFVVKDKDKSKSCRGFGYITFALSEDASKALNAGIEIGGRKVSVTVADKKPRKRDNYKQKNEKSLDDTSEVPVDESKAANDDKKEIRNKPKLHEKGETDEVKRTIIMSGLPLTLTKSKLKLLCSKHGKIHKIQHPAPDREEGTSFVTFKSIKGAVRAFQKLNGSKLEDNIIHSCLITKEGKQPSRKVLDKSKLIVRNIPFKCKEDDVMNAFKKFGNITNVELPTSVDGKGRKRMRGFAFVQFTRQNDAESAIKGLNKTELQGRPMIIDWAVPKDEFVVKNEDAKDDTDITTKNESEDKSLMSMKRKAKLKHDEDEDDKGENEDDDGEDEDGVEEEKEDDQSSEEEEEEEEENEDMESDDENESEDIEEDSENDGDGETDDEDLESQIPKVAKKQSHDVKEGRTVFIRNLPFEKSEEDLIDVFTKYGPIDDCKVVYDHETGHSRGSAFIKFKDMDVADRLVSESESTNSAGEDGITVAGRKLIIVKAVTRGKVKEIEKQKKDSKKDPKDKRNLSLSTEGVIFPNSEAAKELSEGDLKKREKAWTEKKAKLKDQNYFISKTRLSIRNLPLTVDEKELKSSFLKAIDKKGVKVRRILIMRNKERVDKTGKGRPLGFAFMEFETHEQALAMLRATNNNPGIFGDNRRPIVEFSVENKLALNLQEKRKERQKQKSGAAGKIGDRDGKEKAEAGKNKERREKWQKKKEKRKEGREEGERKSGATFGKKRKLEKKLGGGTGEQDKGSVANKKGKFSSRKGDQSQEKSQKRTDNDIDKRNLPSSVQRHSQDKGGKRKRIADAENQSKPEKIKEITKRRRTDKEEEKFTSLVNKYKEKLFGGNKPVKKNDDKRWFE